jgi:hypothetical protein
MVGVLVTLESILSEEDLACIAVFQAAGWEDARHKKPFHKDYNRFAPLTQAAYEVGRLLATNVMSAGIDPPPWPISNPYPVPRNISEMVKLAAHRVGTPFKKRRVVYQEQEAFF